MDIYRKAKESNFDRILVLEDDAYFKDYSVKQLQFLNQWLGKYQSTYDILYLVIRISHGYGVLFIISTLSNLSHLFVTCLCDYKTGIDKILNLVEQNPQYQNIHIDKVFAQENNTKYTRFR